ncbi:MAG: type II toxin-antitoxin system VapC family toxin [Candidatus Pacebacteria bacterium]|nr:type II toxin-antitoxin system VapC family toxin [Candidatus Paceibacterota bacterium]NUQ44213.1 type II toxin-antitoxin system VapC family toxin [Calditrichaceae bacterium]
MYLVDTNIFLEILLKQAKSQKCKDFLDQNVSDLSITDFSLHSIGVILFKQSEDDLFLKFLNDTLPKVNLTSLPKEQYKEVLTNRKKQKLDFDDAYQYTVCKHYGFKLATMDQDFKSIKDIDILFL